MASGRHVALAAQLTGLQALRDRTWKLIFNTQELGEDAAQLTGLLQEQGWLLFSPNDDLDLDDIPEVKAEVDDSKTPSQRLRSVLYVYWEQKGSPDNWQTFYTTQMERLIRAIKEKLI